VQLRKRNSFNLFYIILLYSNNINKKIVLGFIQGTPKCEWEIRPDDNFSKKVVQCV